MLSSRLRVIFLPHNRGLCLKFDREDARPEPVSPAAVRNNDSSRRQSGDVEDASSRAFDVPAEDGLWRAIQQQVEADAALARSLQVRLLCLALSLSFLIFSLSLLLLYFLSLSTKREIFPCSSVLLSWQAGGDEEWEERVSPVPSSSPASSSSSSSDHSSNLVRYSWLTLYSQEHPFHLSNTY